MNPTQLALVALLGGVFVGLLISAVAFLAWRARVQAQEQADGDLWRFGEAIPAAGANLTAVREVAETIDDLVVNALEPATGLSLQNLAPVDGRIDVAQLDLASDILDRASAALTDARSTVDGIDRSALIDQVASGVAELDDALAQIEPVVEPAQRTLAILPAFSAPRARGTISCSSRTTRNRVAPAETRPRSS